MVGEISLLAHLWRVSLRSDKILWLMLQTIVMTRMQILSGHLSYNWA